MVLLTLPTTLEECWGHHAFFQPRLALGGLLITPPTGRLIGLPQRLGHTMMSLILEAVESVSFPSPALVSLTVRLGSHSIL